MRTPGPELAQRGQVPGRAQPEQLRARPGPVQQPGLPARELPARELPGWLLE